MQIPTNVLRVIAREHERQAAQEREMAEHERRNRHADRERHERALRAAKVILTWAKQFARATKLPANGIAIGPTASIDPDGTLCIGYQRFGVGAMWHGKRPNRFREAPIDTLEDIASAIETGEIWEQIAELN